MPRPEVTRAFFFTLPDDEDLGPVIDIVRGLKLSNLVPSIIKVASDLYGLGTVARYPFERTSGKTPLPDPVRFALRREHGVGAWVVSGAFYGASEATILPLIEHVRALFERGPLAGKARYISHEEAADNPILRVHLSTFTGTPTRDELGLLEWRPGGGATWFLPTTPMMGATANEHQALSRRILAEHGFEYMAEYACGPRVSRTLHLIVFNREDAAERARMTACYRALANAYSEAGYTVSRAPLDFQREAMARLEGVPSVCRDIKAALDPGGVIAPGKYGIEEGRRRARGRRP